MCTVFRPSGVFSEKVLFSSMYSICFIAKSVIIRRYTELPRVHAASTGILLQRRACSKVSNENMLRGGGCCRSKCKCKCRVSIFMFRYRYRCVSFFWGLGLGLGLSLSIINTNPNSSWVLISTAAVDPHAYAYSLSRCLLLAA